MTSDIGPTLFCANHPQRETLLRCNKCEKPICAECAVLTPTGYRCKECVRGQEKRFETSRQGDAVIAFFVALIFSFGGSFAARILGFFTVFIAPIVGMILVEIIRVLLKKRRSQGVLLASAVGAAIGAIPLLIVSILNLAGIFPLGLYLGGGWLQMVWQGVYAFFITSTVYYRSTGIRL